MIAAPPGPEAAPTLNAPEAERFLGVTWRALRGVSGDHLQRLAEQLELMSFADGAVFQDFSGTAVDGRGHQFPVSPSGGRPVLLFVSGGWFCTWSRFANGMMGSQVIVGRGRVFGDSRPAGAGGAGPVLEQRVQAFRGARGWVLTAERAAKLYAELPALRQALERQTELRAVLVRSVAHLRKSDGLRGAAVSALADLVMASDLDTFEPGQTIIEAGSSPAGLYILASGTAQERAANGEPAALVQAGAGFGCMLHGERTETRGVVALEACTVAVIHLDQLAREVNSSPGLRRVAGHLLDSTSPAREASIVLVGGDGDFPLSALAFFAAAELHASYGDACALLTLRHEGDAVRPDSVRDGVLCSELAVGAANVRDRVLAFRAAHRELDFVMLDPAGLPWGTIASLGDVLSRVALVVRDTFADPPVWWRADQVSWAVQLSNNAADFQRQDARANSQPFNVSSIPYQFGTVRVRFGMERLRTATRLVDVLPSDRERLQRWVRSISDRRVGVALGGGGAWGYAHVGLMRLLRQKGVPVDVVSGSSFGSLCGAYYCALDDATWVDALVSVGKRAKQALRTAFFSSAALQSLVDKDLRAHLGFVPALTGLEVPLLPVATNLGLGGETVIGIGSVGWGTRCSSSFPGIIAPTTGPGYRFVDGGIVRNVPTDPLLWNDCDLVIASNIVALPRFEAEPRPRLPGRFGRFLHEFDLVRRATEPPSHVHVSRVRSAASNAASVSAAEMPSWMMNAITSSGCASKNVRTTSRPSTSGVAPSSQ